MKKKPETLLLFYVLVIYILLQFVWWTYLLTNLTGESFSHKEAELRALIKDEMVLNAEIANIKKKQHSRITMIVGEGSVFLILLALGIYRVKKSFEKETLLAKQQKNFMLSVTHELKTPLAAIKLNLQTLQKRKLDEEQKELMISNAVQETDRLNQLLENVLLAARMDNAELQFHKEEINFSELLGHLIDSTFTSSRIKKEIEPGIMVNSDRLALPSLVSNLIENALKYSKGVVTVALRKDQGSAVLEVTDEGPGIPQEEKENVFKKFYRRGNEETRRSKGTGLGLYIVKHITEKNNASIEILDNKPAGAIFRVTFR